MTKQEAKNLIEAYLEYDDLYTYSISEKSINNFINDNNRGIVIFDDDILSIPDTCENCNDKFMCPICEKLKL